MGSMGLHVSAVCLCKDGQGKERENPQICHQCGSYPRLHRQPTQEDPWNWIQEEGTQGHQGVCHSVSAFVCHVAVTRMRIHPTSSTPSSPSSPLPPSRDCKLKTRRFRKIKKK